MIFRLVAVAAVLSLVVAGCSSGGSGGTADGSPAVSTDVATNQPDPGTDVGDGADDATDAGDRAGGEMAAGGEVCTVLQTLYHDITTLPERVENEGVTDEDAAAIIAPAQAMKDDLPGMVGTVLTIFKNDLKAAAVIDTAAEMEEYLARGTHDTALDELVSGTRSACDLPATWPEDS